MAIKFINMRQDAIEDMRKAQEEMSQMQTTTAKEAFEKVNSDLASAWGRIKNMFVTFFQNAFGNNSGIQGLLSKVEGFLARLKGYLEEESENGWIAKLREIIGNLATWLADKLDPILDWIGNQLDELLKPGAGNPLVNLWEYIKNMLIKNAMKIGLLIGAGMLIASNPIGALIAGTVLGAIGLASMYAPDEDNTDPMAGKKSEISKLRGQAGQHTAKINDITSKRAALDKYNPETVTYGKMKNADGTEGPAGFMTVGQKEAQLDEEKEKEQAALKQIQEDIKKNTDEMNVSLKEIAERKKAAEASKPDPYSPVLGDPNTGFNY